MLFGKRKTDKPEPARRDAPTDKVLLETHHFRAVLRSGLVVGEVLTEQVTERESKLLLDEIAQATDESGSARLVLDMKHVGVLASAGIGLLVQVHKRLKASGGALAVYGLSEDISQLLKLTRMDKLFTIADTEAEATEKATG